MKAAEEVCSRDQACCKHGSTLHMHAPWVLTLNSVTSLQAHTLLFSRFLTKCRDWAVLAILRQGHSVWLVLPFGKAEQVVACG